MEGINVRRILRGSHSGIVGVTGEDADGTPRRSFMRA